MEKLKCVKMNMIMRNMLIRAVTDVKNEKEENGLDTAWEQHFLEKLWAYEEKKKKFYLQDDEYRQSIRALNKLRDAYLAAGRYSDGIDIVLMKILQAKYKKPRRGYA